MSAFFFVFVHLVEEPSSNCFRAAQSTRCLGMSAGSARANRCQFHEHITDSVLKHNKTKVKQHIRDRHALVSGSSGRSYQGADLLAVLIIHSDTQSLFCICFAIRGIIHASHVIRVSVSFIQGTENNCVVIMPADAGCMETLG